MYPVWGTWLKHTLLAYVLAEASAIADDSYIPLYGTYRWVREAPVTQATRRLSVYLILRRLLSDSEPPVEGEDGFGERKKFRSKHLTEYLGQEVTYSRRLHKDVDGTWSSFCNCLW